MKNPKITLLAALFCSCFNTHENVYSIPEKNRNRTRFDNEFEREMNIPQAPKYKFKEEYKNFFEVKEGKIYLDGELIFVSKRKTLPNIWSDFVKNFWYLNKNTYFRKTIIEAYKEAYGVCDVK